MSPHRFSQRNGIMKQSRCVASAILGSLLSAPFAVGQTLINLAAQSKNEDFSAAVATKPAKVGTTLPATCSVGEVFFKTNAPPGQNLFGCTATNIWSDLGSG